MVHPPRNKRKVESETGKPGVYLQAHIVTPLKINITQESNSIINFSFVKQLRGYSKASNVLELVKAFSLKDVCLFSCEAAPHYLLFQSATGFPSLTTLLLKRKSK